MTSAGFMLIISSPSGAGKTTLARKLTSVDKNLILSISVTTRPLRPSEVEGKDYFFKTKDEFEKMVSDDELLEHAEVFGNFYGTPRKFVERNLKEGKDVVFDIDWQGAKILKKHNKRIVSIFILPPSKEELLSRLKNRAEDSIEAQSKRMKMFETDVLHWKEYDYIVTNDNVDSTLETIIAIVKSERNNQAYPKEENDRIEKRVIELISS
jgi:guanylate kinase